MEHIQNKSHVYIHVKFIFLQNCELDHRNSSPIGPWAQNSLSSSFIFLGPESDLALISALVSLRIQLMHFVPRKQKYISTPKAGCLTPQANSNRYPLFGRLGGPRAVLGALEGKKRLSTCRESKCYSSVVQPGYYGPIWTGLKEFNSK